ncbi:MAG: hypothetical protein WEA11_04615 [Acidimicrobiales bacterium]
MGKKRTTTDVYDQLKKAQGETNDRLEELIAEQKQTNQLLAALVGATKVIEAAHQK